MAGLEGRSREFRVLHDGLPRFDGPAPKTKSTSTKTPAAKSSTHTAADDSHAPAQTAPAPPGLASTPRVQAAPASAAGESPLAPAALRPRPTSPPARPVVRRSREWRWFGWFRQRPVGHGKPEQIELRLEDVRPVRSTLEGEDFVVVENQNSRPVAARRNPFASSGKPVAGMAEGRVPSEPVSEAPRSATVETNGPMNRLARWFRNRETTALK